jgi:hypothetical protein
MADCDRDQMLYADLASNFDISEGTESMSYIFDSYIFSRHIQ